MKPPPHVRHMTDEEYAAAKRDIIKAEAERLRRNVDESNLARRIKKFTKTKEQQ